MTLFDLAVCVDVVFSEALFARSLEEEEKEDPSNVFIFCRVFSFCVLFGGTNASSLDILGDPFLLLGAEEEKGWVCFAFFSFDVDVFPDAILVLSVARFEGALDEDDEDDRDDQEEGEEDGNRPRRLTILVLLTLSLAAFSFAFFTRHSLMVPSIDPDANNDDSCQDDACHSIRVCSPGVHVGLRDVHICVDVSSM